MDAVRRHKDRAAAYLAKGKRKHALKELRAALELGPGDVLVRQKVADLLLRLGHKDAAIREYQSVAGKYAADGFFVKAMAICKVILRIDAAHTETQDVLARLFGQSDPGGVLPANMTAALASPSLRVTPSEPRGTRATGSMAAASQPADGASPAPRALIPAMEMPRAMPAVAVGAAEEPPRPAPSGPAAAQPLAEEAPDTLVLGLFDEELAATLEVRPAEVSDASDLYLDPSAEADTVWSDDETFDEEALVAASQSDTGEMSVDLSRFPPIPLFSQLGRDAFMAVFERLAVRRVEEGERLITEGATTRTMYILAEGEVRVFRERHGATGELARLLPGSFFGEIALLSKAPRMASVEAVRPSLLFEVTREDVAQIVAAHPSVTDVLGRFYRERFLQNLVRSNPLLFSPLTDEEKRAVFERFESTSVPAGTVLLEKGEMGQGLYLILRGECDVTDPTPDGRLLELPGLREGDFFGEMSLLLNAPVSATVCAKTACLVLRLPRDVFYERVMRHPEVRRLITDVTNERLQQAVAAEGVFAPHDPVLL